MDKTIYESLIKPLPKEAIQKSEGAKTGKGYDTTGYGYQYIVNRLNEVLGIDGWNYEFEILDRHDGTSRSGSSRISVCVKIKLMVGTITKPMVGGHVSNNYVDALKGAVTNALKKAAAMFGVGKDAYEKTIDEDNLAPDINKKAETKAKDNLNGNQIIETISTIRGTTHKPTLIKWQKGIEVSEIYTPTQKRVLLGAIEETLKELK